MYHAVVSTLAFTVMHRMLFVKNKTELVKIIFNRGSVLCPKGNRQNPSWLATLLYNEIVRRRRLSK